MGKKQLNRKVGDSRTKRQKKKKQDQLEKWKDKGDQWGLIIGTVMVEELVSKLMSFL